MSNDKKKMVRITEINVSSNSSSQWGDIIMAYGELLKVVDKQRFQLTFLLDVEVVEKA